MTTNKNAQAASTPPPVNYATLQADVAEYIADLLESTRYVYGETDAEADARIAKEAEELRRTPWVALLWYVEHMAQMDRIASVERGEPMPEGLAEAGDQLKPEYREVEMDGEIVLCGNTDATIQMMGNSDTPEARDLMGKYQEALAALKEANGGTSTMFMREEAFQTAMEQVGIVVEVSAPSQAATQ